MTSGIVIVDKPPGWTSHDVVGRLRRLAGTRKVGHAGTLDPMATGVLVVGVNKATRLLGHLMLGEKEYEATIRLGQSTVTDDREGDVIESTDASQLSSEAITLAAGAFVGDIAQVPSSVSAIKVDGKRSYARVRSGEDVTLKSRPVHVAVFEINGIGRTDTFVDVDVRVVCSSGTYIRALARDLGRALHVGGHLVALRRTRVGPFTIDRAKTLDELATDLSIVGLSEVARSCFRSVDVTADEAASVRFGRRLPDLVVDAGSATALFAPDGEFLALYGDEVDEGAERGAKPIAVFATLNPS